MLDELNVMNAVDNAVSLKEIAKMARLSEMIKGTRTSEPLADYVLEKHYQRKHGPGAYYGQR